MGTPWAFFERERENVKCHSEAAILLLLLLLYLKRDLKAGEEKSSKEKKMSVSKRGKRAFSKKQLQHEQD